jgi:rhodanese-related sulfurtransferase
MDLDPVQAQQWLSQKDAPLLVDVRNPDEYAQEHLANSQLMPLPELEKRWSELPKDRPILLYCLAGKRSQKAYDLLKAKGFADLHQITGGLTAWKEQRLPVLSNTP